MYQLILLDRDGVINVDSPDYIKSPDEWQPIDGALAAIARLAKYTRVAVCTNQSGVGRGLFELHALNAIHAKMRAALALEGGEFADVFYCPHTPDEGCDCRKPKPGLLLKAMRDCDVAPAQCCYVGDSLKDVQAAVTAGCQPILVMTGNGKKTLGTLPKALISQTLIYDNLAAFAADATSH